MATIPSTPRTNLITLATESAGPFLVGFRLLDADGLTVYVNGVEVTNFTLSATFVDGYDDSATITFLTSLPATTEIQIDGANPAERADDYVNGDPLLTAKMNIELARMWASISEIGQGVRRAVRGLSEISPLPDAVAADLSNLGAAVASAQSSAAAAAVSAADALAKQNSMLRWLGNWVTATAYSLSDIVYQGGSAYICIIAHTSGTFGTDLGALRWTLFAQQGASGPGTGDMLKTENLSGLASVTTARANLGLDAMAIKANVAFSDLAGAAVRLLSEGLTSPSETELPTTSWVKGYADSVGRVLLASKTASASAQLDFTEFNNAVYRYYEFEFENVKPATNAVTFHARVSTDGGLTYDSGAGNYQISGIVFSGTASAMLGGGQTNIAMFLSNSGDVGNGASALGVSGTSKLRFAGNASTQTRLDTHLTYDSQVNNINTVISGCRRVAAQDTDAMRFYFSSGNIASGTIRMYGII